MKMYMADFETTTKPENAHVWAFGVCELYNQDNTTIGTTIDEFMSWCFASKSNDKIYFHNLKFDGQFIIDWLLHNGYEHVCKKEDRKAKTFTTLISDKGLYYAIEVINYKKGKKIRKVTYQDSLKLIPLSVENIAKSFKMPMQKGSIDYTAHDNLPVGSPITEEEKDYLIRDIRIVATALEFFFNQGLDKMTIGACALDEYKKLVKKFNFERWFPSPKFHDDVKQSYKGGFTYLNPKYAGKTIGNGIVLDVNSLYPSVMRYEYLPYSEPIFFKGKYQYDAVFPLYTQMIRCCFEIKPNKIPTIQIKGSFMFKGNEYLTSSNDDIVVLCLNSVDLELFLEHYDVYNLEYISGWKFKATQGLFDDYIDKWSDEKIKAKLEGNHGMYLISKLFLNNLYGKFGTDTTIRSKIPYLGDDDRVHYKDSEPETKEGVYVAIASFITSYARRKTILAAQRIQDDYRAGKSNIEFVYADTDSLHCVSPNFELPDLDIDSTRLGAWDHEMNFTKGKYLRQKCYIENEIIKEKDYREGIESDKSYLYSMDNGQYCKLKITVAGMPKGCYPYVTFRNFKIGATYKGKKQPKVVPGGVVLNEVDFTIKN